MKATSKPKKRGRPSTRAKAASSDNVLGMLALGDIRPDAAALYDSIDFANKHPEKFQAWRKLKKIVVDRLFQAVAENDADFLNSFARMAELRKTGAINDPLAFAVRLHAEIIEERGEKPTGENVAAALDRAWRPVQGGYDPRAIRRILRTIGY
ncbi:MAG: hypothetical protein IAE97_10560 [Chthoniobacterales bacterium]|nr:hypothetical protein [Chthoniobacterales bacterium]